MKLLVTEIQYVIGHKDIIKGAVTKFIGKEFFGNLNPELYYPNRFKNWTEKEVEESFEDEPGETREGLNKIEAYYDVSYYKYIVKEVTDDQAEIIQTQIDAYNEL